MIIFPGAIHRYRAVCNAYRICTLEPSRPRHCLAACADQSYRHGHSSRTVSNLRHILPGGHPGAPLFSSSIFDWKCRDDGELPLKNDEFRSKNGHYVWNWFASNDLFVVRFIFSFSFYSCVAGGGQPDWGRCVFSTKNDDVFLLKVMILRFCTDKMMIL